MIDDLVARILPLTQKTVFVTRATWTGDLGGIIGAHLKCQTAADGPTSIVPPGEYKAWISLRDGTSPSTEFIRSSIPYGLPDGTRVANNYADLTDLTIITPINLDEAGIPFATPNQHKVWTGTKADGRRDGFNLHPAKTCLDWTSQEHNHQIGVFHGTGGVAHGDNNDNGITGRIDKTNLNWSQGTTLGCDQQFDAARIGHLYCFQQ